MAEKIAKFLDHQDCSLCQIRFREKQWKSAICDIALCKPVVVLHFVTNLAFDRWFQTWEMRQWLGFANLPRSAPRERFSQPGHHLLTHVCIIILGGFHCSQMSARGPNRDLAGSPLQSVLHLHLLHQSQRKVGGTENDRPIEGTKHVLYGLNC